jgi:hypothetical protein
MELLNVAKARSIWLFDLNDLNPRGKHLIPELLDWLREAYAFLKFPASFEDQEADTKALAFLHGNFQLRDEYFIEADLRIYNDGLVADTRSSTDDTDLFLKDVVESATKEFSLNYQPSLIRKRLYASELNVRCDHALNNLNPKLEKLGRKLSSLAKTNLPAPIFELSSIAFWTEPIQGAAGPSFRLERKLNTSLSENRYYSSAPLKTDEHLQLLQDIESLLGE